VSLNFISNCLSCTVLVLLPGQLGQWTTVDKQQQATHSAAAAAAAADAAAADAAFHVDCLLRCLCLQVRSR
jgi:hypothetical protein